MIIYSCLLFKGEKVYRENRVSSQKKKQLSRFLANVFAPGISLVSSDFAFEDTQSVASFVEFLISGQKYWFGNHLSYLYSHSSPFARNSTPRLPSRFIQLHFPHSS